jgi:hypothetical protein
MVSIPKTTPKSYIEGVFWGWGICPKQHNLKPPPFISYVFGGKSAPSSTTSSILRLGKIPDTYYLYPNYPNLNQNYLNPRYPISNLDSIFYYLKLV